MAAKKRQGPPMKKSSPEARSQRASGERPAPPAPAAPQPEKKSKAGWIILGVVIVIAGLWVWKQMAKKDARTLPPKPVEQERADWKPLISGARAMESISRLLAIGPRVAGTPGSERAQAMIKAELEAAGVRDIRDQKFTTNTPKGERSMNNIIGVIPGKRRECIVLAAHYDSKHFDEFVFLGANDAASAVGVLIELARALAPGAGDHELSYYFVFFDGEEAFLKDWHDWEQSGGGQDHTYGSRHMVEEIKRNRDAWPFKALILLDLVGDKDYSLAEDRAGFSPELLSIFEETSKEVFGVDYFVQQIPVVDDHVPFREARICPVIDLIDFEFGPGQSPGGHWHQPTDTIDQLDPKSLERTGTLVLSALPKVEAMVLKGLGGAADTRGK